MGKWLISTVDNKSAEFLKEKPYPLSCYDYGFGFLEDEYDYGFKVLIYDDERDAFINDVSFRYFLIGKYEHLQDMVFPRFCNAKTVYKRDDKDQHSKSFGYCTVEPMYPEQTILSDLTKGSIIPKNRIRYFVIHKRILADGTETFKLVGNDRTNRYIRRPELNLLLHKGLIVNHKDLRYKIRVLYEAKEKANKEKLIPKFEKIFQHSIALGIPQPKLEYVFQGDDVIVTGINREWLKQNVPVTKVIDTLHIPEGVTKIADGAFYVVDSGFDFKNLELPSTLKEIGSFSFFGRARLTSVKLNGTKVANETKFTNGTKLTRIGDHAFARCRALNLKLNLDKTFTEFEDGVFLECNVVEVNFIEAPSVYRIGTAAFMGTRVKMKLPESLVEIGAYAFYDSSFEDKYVVIPDSVAKIGDFAFSKCDLHSVELPHNLKVLPEDLFSHSKLKHIPKLPETLEKIGAHCFFDCKDMSGELEVPDSVEEIGGSAFANCPNITKAKLSSKIKRLASELFTGCTNLREVILPDKVEMIGFRVFEECIKMTEVHIPPTVSAIDDHAFLECSNLQKVDYEPECIKYLPYDTFGFKTEKDNAPEASFLQDMSINVSDDYLENGDLVVFFARTPNCELAYGVFDHMTADENPKAVVWMLPVVSYADAQVNDTQPIRYEVKGLRPRKVVYDEKNINQRIIYNYLRRCINL